MEAWTGPCKLNTCAGLDPSEIGQHDLQLMTSLREMRQRRELCDLVFELGSVKFILHRLVVAAWSPLMKTFLLRHSEVDPKTSPHHLPDPMQTIHVVYDHHEVFERFISFLYAGEAGLDGNNIAALLLLATTFQVDSLRVYCEHRLEANLNVENVIDLYHLAMKYQLRELEFKAIQFLQQHLSEAVVSPGLRDLSPAGMNIFLSSHHVSQLSPEIKLFLIISWITEDVQERQRFLVLLLKHINWCLVAQDFLLEISQTDNFFTSNPSSLYLLLQTLQSSSISLGPYEDQFEDLKQEHSHLLSSVVSGSVALGNGKMETFQPIRFYLASSPFVDAQNMPPQDEGKVAGENSISNSPEMSLATNETTPENDSSPEEDSKVTQDIHLTSGQKESDSNCLNRVCLRSDKFTVRKHNTTSRQHNAAMKKEKLNQETKSASHANRLRLTRSRKRKSSEDFSGKADVSKLVAMDTTSCSSVKRSDTSPQLIVTSVTSIQSNHRKERGKKVKLMNLPKVTKSDPDLHTLLDEKFEKSKEGANCLFSCDLCVFKSRQNKDYQKHLLQQHFPSPPYICGKEKCFFSTGKFSELLSHRKQHTDIRPYVCNICLACFRSRNNIHAHFKIHSDEKKFECPECRTSFKLKKTLEQHMVTHDDLRPYLCDLCGFSTKFQSHLIAHKRIHTGEVYHCNFPDCSYFTPKRSQLKAHMRSHLGIRSHVCSDCGKAFVERSHLVRHERTHSAVKNHNCTSCSYSSIRADKLREHVRKHHRDGLAEVPAGSRCRLKKEASAGGIETKQEKECLLQLLDCDGQNTKTVTSSGLETSTGSVVSQSNFLSLSSQYSGSGQPSREFPSNNMIQEELMAQQGMSLMDTCGEQVINLAGSSHTYDGFAQSHFLDAGYSQQCAYPFYPSLPTSHHLLEYTVADASSAGCAGRNIRPISDHQGLMPNLSSCSPSNCPQQIDQEHRTWWTKI